MCYLKISHQYALSVHYDVFEDNQSPASSLVFLFTKESRLCLFLHLSFQLRRF